MKKPKTTRSKKTKKKRKSADPLITLCPGCKQPWLAQGVRVPDKDTCSLCGGDHPAKTRTQRVRESSITSWVSSWIPPGIDDNTWAVFPRRVGTSEPPSYQVRFRSRNQHFDIGMLLEPDAKDTTYDPLDHAKWFCDQFAYAVINIVTNKRRRARR